MVWKGLEGFAPQAVWFWGRTPGRDEAPRTGVTGEEPDAQGLGVPEGRLVLLSCTHPLIVRF